MADAELEQRAAEIILEELPQAAVSLSHGIAALAERRIEAPLYLSQNDGTNIAKGLRCVSRDPERALELLGL